MLFILIKYSLGTMDDSSGIAKNNPLFAGEEGDVVVSVMLPTKAPSVGNATDPAGFTSLDQLYVVVLKPSQTYTTYACGLNRSVLI